MINMFIVVYRAGGLYYLIKFVIVIVMITAGVWDVLDKKVQVGKDQEKAQSEKKKIPTPKTEVGKNQTNNQALTPYRKPNEQLFSQ